MSRDIYAHITTAVLAVALGFCVFLVISDNRVPFTTQATVKTLAIEVVPEVSGYIEELMVNEGERVTIGTPLFTLDSSAFEIAKQKAQASLDETKSQWQQAQRHLERLQTLYKSKSVSKESLEDGQIAVDEAYGGLLVAKAELKSAERDLSKTQVVAQQTGRITNLAYKTGMYVSSGSPVVDLIDEQALWLDADFTEKGLPALTSGRAVNIVFDAYPMVVFHGHISSVDSAISSGVSSTGQLAEITEETRWIRAQQKIRTRIVLDDDVPMLVAGSRASVMVRDDYSVADTWMTLLSWLRYIY